MLEVAADHAAIGGRQRARIGQRAEEVFARLAQVARRLGLDDGQVLGIALLPLRAGAAELPVAGRGVDGDRSEISRSARDSPAE